MAIRKVVTDDTDDEFLRKKSKKVLNFDEKLWELLDDMKETMDENDGIGIASVQVGVLKRAIVVKPNNMFLELINPVIVSQEGEDFDDEGCLSVKGVRGFVGRPKKVTVRAQDRYGYDFEIKGEKYLARVLCHEIDHLDGILFVDRAIKLEGKRK